MFIHNKLCVITDMHDPGKSYVRQSKDTVKPDVLILLIFEGQILVNFTVGFFPVMVTFEKLTHTNKLTPALEHTNQVADQLLKK